MTEPSTGALLILPDDGVGEAGELVQALAVRLGQPVMTGLRELVAAGVQRIVALQLVSSEQDREQGVAGAIQWASRRWPFLSFHRAEPLGWQEWANLVKVAAMSALSSHSDDTAVLLVGAGGSNALMNADLARLAHLVAQGSEFSRVVHAFVAAARPALPDALADLARLGLRDIVLVPWRVDPGFGAQAEQTAQALGIRASLAVAPFAHPDLIDILASRHKAAMEDDSLLAPSWDEVLAEVAQSAGNHGSSEEAQLRDLDRRINEMLPPQYQGRYEEVRPQSMGSAALRFGSDGKVAWDEMWTSYCDLALAGGPAHRGTLLEAVPATEALAEPDRYQAVAAEIERGIRLVTGLEVVSSQTPGWVGVRCESEEMAVWLLRAIIVENVMVRREGDVLFLPAGPQFTLKREIKNVVTVLAKTCHYWTAHLGARRRASAP
jgi:sirohydrochlorin cobaltochelatase